MNFKTTISSALHSHSRLSIAALAAGGLLLCAVLVVLIRASDYIAVALIVSVAVWATAPTRPRSQERNDPLKSRKDPSS